MKGYWHIVGLAVTAAAISVVFDLNLFIILFPWLASLYTTNRLRFIPFILSILAFLFFIQYLPEVDRNSEISTTESRTVEGKIIKPPVLYAERIEVILHDSISDENVMITHFSHDGELSREDTFYLRHGANCIVRGELEVPEGASNIGEFDYRDYLLAQGIDKQMLLNDLSELNCTGASFWQRFISLRNDLIERTPEKVSDYTVGWINALVLGDDSMIDEEVITLFQDWGLSHILAISGLHIGIVVGLIYVLLIKTGLFTREKAELIILIFLPFYAILAGSEPSVLRASMMVVLFILLQRLKIRLSGLDVISIVFLCLLIWNPYLIYHIGFQFSFIVTFGIILSRRWLSSTSSPSFQILIISFISQMVILPLQLNYFSLFQPLSILLNLVIVPYFSIFVIPFMFLFLLFSSLPAWILRGFDFLFVEIHQQVINFIEWIDDFLDYPLYLSNLPGWFFIVYYLLLVLSVLFIERKRWMEGFISFVMLTFLLTGYAAAPYFSDKGAVTMIDIGQGDSFIIELPNREGTIMIDAGARFSFEDFEATSSVYERILKPYLRANGIYQIDALFLTHEDLDHIGSVGFMMEDDLLEKIYISNYFEVPDEFFEIGRRKEVSIERLQVGEIVDVNNQLFTVVSPFRDKQSPNENSLVLHTIIGGKSWLFTGDIGVEEELDITNHFNFQVNVLKVAHHGSNTSSGREFVEKINPEVALIPVGRNNSYGHPTSEVMETFEELGVEIYRTDQHGAVRYEFIHDTGTFQPFITN